MICADPFTIRCEECGEEKNAVVDRHCLKCQEILVLVNSRKPSVWLTRAKAIKRIFKEWKSIKSIEIKYHE